MLRLTLVIILLSSTVYSSYADVSDETKVAELLQLQQKSGTGVIKLTTELFEKYVEGQERPYSVFIVADAKQFRNSAKLQLGKLMREYALVAKAYAKKHAGTPAAGKVFFASIEYGETKDIFGKLGVPGLPFLARIAPTANVKKSGSTQIGEEEKLSIQEYPWSASVISSFVQERTGIHAGDVAEISQERSRFLPVLTLMVVAGMAQVGWQLYNAPMMQTPAIYAAGALFIMWFSVSGGMYNIIRNVPLIGMDPRTRQTVLFLPGQGQMGAEGFIMGTFYTSFGLIVFFFMRMLPTIKDDRQRRMVGFALLAAEAIIMKWVLGGHSWKTGMRSWWYW